MKYILFTIFGIALLGGIWFFGKEKPVDTEHTEQQISGELQEQVFPTATINKTTLQLEVVRTVEEQTKGLSGRELLAQNTGILFVYEKQSIPGFWMPDMNFSIDIIWINKNKKIVGITNNISPETYPEIFRAPSPVLYVLEVNASWAENNGVAVGDEIIFHNVF